MLLPMEEADATMKLKEDLPTQMTIQAVAMVAMVAEAEGIPTKKTITMVEVIHLPE